MDNPGGDVTATLNISYCYGAKGNIHEIRTDVDLKLMHWHNQAIRVLQIVTSE